MEFNGVIERKLAYLREQVALLRSWQLGTVAEFATDRLLCRAVERQLQVCAEAVIDICERVLAVKKEPPVQAASERVEKLAELGILADPAPYRSMVQFRNFIVPRYEQIDPEILYEIAVHHVDRFEQFAAEIDAAGREDVRGTG